MKATRSGIVIGLALALLVPGVALGQTDAVEANPPAPSGFPAVEDGRASMAGDEERKPSVGTPRDDLTDVSEAAWTRLEFLDGGRELDVYYLSGVPSCYGLDHVEVTMSEAGLDVRVFVGTLPLDEATSCILPMDAWVTRVDLGERLAFGSNGEDEEAEVAWLQQVHDVKMAAIHELSRRLPGYIMFYPHKSDYYEEDFRFTAKGRQYALQFFENPETTKDDLVNTLLEQARLMPTYPPYPGQETQPAD